MINAPCAYQAVDSFAQCELCLSKQVRGRGIFITVKVADTDQKSINPQLPHLPPTTTPLRQCRPWLESSKSDWRQMKLQVLWFPQLRNLQMGKTKARSLIAWACKPRPGPYQPTGSDIHTPCSPTECKGHQIGSGIAPPGNMGMMIQSTFGWSIKLHDFHIK